MHAHTHTHTHTPGGERRFISELPNPAVLWRFENPKASAIRVHHDVGREREAGRQRSRQAG
eukprot:2472027-Heterocapsa_arctica.AAC.1